MFFCGEKAWYTESDNSEFEEVVKMKDGKHPNPNTIHPIAGYDKEIYVKPTITNPNIIVGDFTYIADSDFESHVSHYTNGMMTNSSSESSVKSPPELSL